MKIYCSNCHVFEVFEAGDLCLTCYNHCLDERYRIYELQNDYYDDMEEIHGTEIQEFS